MADQNTLKSRFTISYHIKHHEDGFDVKDLPEGYGATDRLFVMSSITNPDNEHEDYAFITLDGVAGDSIPPEGIFKMWVILAGMLSQNLPPGDMRKELCKDVLGIVQRTMDSEDGNVEGVENKIITSGSETVN